MSFRFYVSPGLFRHAPFFKSLEMFVAVKILCFGEPVVKFYFLSGSGQHGNTAIR